MENYRIAKVDGYAVITRRWKEVTKLILISRCLSVKSLLMKGKEDSGKMAFQRGPVIYCAEWPDNNTVMCLIWL